MATMEGGNTMKSDFDKLRVEAAATIAQENAEAANNGAGNDETAGVEVEDQAEQVNDNEGMGNRMESKSTNIHQRLIESMKAADELARIYESPEIGSAAPGARDSKYKKEEQEDEDGKVATGKKRGPYKKPTPKLEEVLSALHLEEEVKRSITVHASLEYASMVEAIKMRHQISYDVEDRIVQSNNMQTEVEGALESLEALVGVDHDLYHFGQDLLDLLVGETRFLEELRLEALSVLQ